MMGIPRIAKHRSFVGFLCLLAVLGVFLKYSSTPLRAANGDNLRTIIADRTGTDCASVDAAGNHSSTGVGIAFDGVNLLISCYSDNSVTVIDPSDGSQVAVHFIVGATSLGALAYQGPAGPLWACSNFGIVGVIDATLTTFTPVFDTSTVVFPDGQVGGSGCFDGLAYDGQDNTIWASGDVSSTTEHYTTTGVGLGKFVNSGLIGGCGNSGIAVGGQLLYLANDGCSQIFEVQKDFSASSLFASFQRRLEDLECDDLTFAVSNQVGAIWSIDAYDNILNAWEIPLGQCAFGGGGGPVPGLPGRMTGGGSINDPIYQRVTHGFQLNCVNLTPPNSLEVNWGNGKKFHLDTLLTARCSDDPALDEGRPKAGFDTYEGSGMGSYNGMPNAIATWKFTDDGEPGKDTDYASIKVVDAMGNVVLMAEGYLHSGNHQAHQCAKCP
jgi:hypothetical protein